MPDPLEEGMEVGDVEVNDFAQRPGIVREVDVEPEVGRPKAVLEGPRIVGAALQEAEFREPLQELRGRRDVDVEHPGHLARKMPTPVAERAEDREAVLPREELDDALKRLLVHGWPPSRGAGGSLGNVEWEGHKVFLGILGVDSCLARIDAARGGPDRTRQG